MSGDTPLWKAHDVAQQLQDKIEVLPGVERAFVHVDHETTHRPVCHTVPYAESLLTIPCCEYRNIENRFDRQVQLRTLYRLLLILLLSLHKTHS